MTSESPNQTTNYMDGWEEEDTDCVHVLTEKEAIRPGCTKIRHFCQADLGKNN